MTNRIAVGTPVTVRAVYSAHKDQNLVVMTDEGRGYGVGIVGNDPARRHSSRHGWLYYDDSYVTPKPAPAFKAGDKVEFIEDYLTHANKGTKATVTYDSCGEFTDVKVDSTGKTLGPFTRRLKLVEEPALTLKVGDKVVVEKDFPTYTWHNTEGIITTVGNTYYRVKVTKAGPNNAKYVEVGKEYTLSGLTLLPPFTYKDIQVGDTIRRTATYKGATEVREGVVGTKGRYYFANEQGNYILAYDTDGTTSITDVTLELLNRPEPEPEPVKEAWEDVRVLTRKYTGDKAPDTFVREADGGWTIHYASGVGKFKIGASEKLGDYLEDAEVKVLAKV